MPSFQNLLWQVAGNGSVASVKNPPYSDLAHPLNDQIGFVLPHARYRYSAGVKVDVLHPRVAFLDRLHKDRKGLISCWIIVASTSSEMRDLYGYVRSLGQKLFQKDASFSCPVRTVVVYVRMHVNCDCHAILIGHVEYAAQSGKVFRIIDIHVGVAEVELESSP
jgi:hypothetical protein